MLLGDVFQHEEHHRGGKARKVRVCRALWDVLVLSSVKRFSSGNHSFGKLWTSCRKT